MKKLLARIRRILRDRRTRKLLTRTVSGFAALVVFVTTYALVLPAITMEAQADCGIEAHQHDDSCYEDVLICEEEESDGHHHDDSCYTSSKELVCDIPEHAHDETCYDEEGNLICEQLEHMHDNSCYEEHRELTCGLEESDGHHHDGSCYEQVLVCGKEVHTHSEACYHNGDTEAEADEMAVMSDAAYTGASAQSASAEETGDLSYAPEYGNENARTGEVATESETADPADDSATDDQNSSDLDVDDVDTAKTEEGSYVPTLNPVVFEQILNKNTGIYYSHIEDGEVVEDSSMLTDWEKIDHDTELGRNDLLRVYLAYTIPAGSLNTANDTARYRLPSNIHLTDAQVKAINEIENGIAGQYVNHDTLEVTDTENYHKYLGAEAVEGTRTPADDVNKYLADHDDQEYINAVVKVENIYNDQGDYLGQDLIFTFTPYSVQKNQHEYDTNGQPIKAGEVIKGWFTLDFNMEQVDWSEPEVSTYEIPLEEAYDIPTEEEENTDIADDTAETSFDNGTADNTDSADSEDTVESSDSDDSSVKDDTVDSSDSAASGENSETTADIANQKKVTTVERSEQTADVVFVPEGTDAQNNPIHEIHTELTRVEETRTETIAEKTSSDEETGEETDRSDTAETNETAETTENSEELPDEKKESGSEEYKDGTLTAEGTGYKITLDYTADAKIPDNATLSVREITAESDREAYEACLKEARSTATEDNKATVDDKASRFFDIEIFVDEQIKDRTDSQTHKQTDDQITDQNPERAEAKNNDRTSEQAIIQDNAQTPEQIDDQIINQTPEQVDNFAAEQNNEQPLKENNSETVTRKIEPAAPVKVNIQLFDTEMSENVDKYNAERYKVIHFAEEGTEEIQEVTAQKIDAEQKQDHSANNNTTSDTPAVAPPTEIQFNTESFSIYGVIYTVDFHWEVNGKTYEFSMPGGGFVSFTDLVEVLGIAKQRVKEDSSGKTDVSLDDEGTQKDEYHPTELSELDTQKEYTQNIDVQDETTGSSSRSVSASFMLENVEIGEETRMFVEDVEDIAFSTPELLSVSKAGENTTVGAIKDALGLACEYSADLDEEQIAGINNTTVESGDWALISLKPFVTEEALTITMKNGDQFVIKVTDAQDALGLDGKQYVISYNDLAMLGQVDHMTWFGGERYAFPNGNNVKDEKAAWTFEYDTNSGKYYLKAYDGKYFRFRWNNGESSNIDLTDRHNASPLTVIQNADGTYRIGTSDSNLISYFENGYAPAYFCGSSQGYGGPQSNLTLIEYGPRKNWLLYLDEDKTKITIGVGDSLTLRPYGEWYWKNDDQPDNLKSKNWTFDDGNWTIPNSTTDTKTDSGNTYTTIYYKTARAANGTIDFRGYSKWDDQLKEFYTVYHGIAKEEGTFVLKNSAGKTITVHVSASSPDKPPTVTRTSNIPVNLFDYDENKVLDPSDNSNVVGGLKYDTINQTKYGNLKFLSSGSGAQGNNINDYSYDRANGGILHSELQTTGNNAGYPRLSDGNGSSSLKYLFDTRNTSWGTYNAYTDTWSPGSDMKAYPGVEGLFQQDTDGFYYFNSNANYAYYNGERIVLYDHTYTQITKDTGVENGKPIGFFPFHNYNSVDDLYVNQNSSLNHHVGMSMDLDFEIPDNKKNNGKDIVFDFSGDDDMWVFIDNELVLDIGGIHQPVRGRIDFTNGKVYVYGKDTVTKTFSVGEHNMKVFYLERGGCDSNCSIKFNLPLYKTLDLSKRLNGLTTQEWNKYKNEEFTYELKVNGQLYNSPAGAANKQSLQAQRIDANGNVTEYFIIQNGQITIKHGETVRIPHLSPSDTFYVAEEKSLNMEQFEAPHAERDYYLVSDGQEHEEEIVLTEGHTTGAAENLSDWYTPQYTVNDTEKVNFTNTLKEKDLEVEKKWLGSQDHPSEVKFTVHATVENAQGVPELYTVSTLKNGQNDKEFTLNAGNEWRTIIEHLPILTPDGKFITYHVTEKSVPGYISRVKDVTESETRCNLDAMKLWPDASPRTEVIRVRLKNLAGQYYVGTDEHGNALFGNTGIIYELKPENNYTQRFHHLPKDDTYTLEEVEDEDETTTGLVTYERTIVDFDIENEPIGGEVDPPAPQENPEIHKRIDALRDGQANPDSPHTGEDLTDLYRLYLDYRINSLQDPAGVDLLFVIDHSGSMNSNEYQGNQYRARAVMEALNGADEEDGIIAEFLDMNTNNQWAAVGFNGPSGVYYIPTIFNPWYLSPIYDNTHAGEYDSEILSPGGLAFTRQNPGVTLDPVHATVLTNYTAGFWRAEQFLQKQSVKDDGRKKVVVFISDGIPTLHIQGLNGSLSGAGEAVRSPYYQDDYGGCPQQALTQFGYFVNDMRNNEYTFGRNMEFYAIGFGGSMQTATGRTLLQKMVDTAYGETDYDGHLMTISDVDKEQPYTNTAAQKLLNDLRVITGLSEQYTAVTIQDDLSKYVDLNGLAAAGSSVTEILKAAKVKVTMTNPDDLARPIVLYENGSIVAANNRTSDHQQILESVTYDATTKTVTAKFDNDYQARPGITYTLSFDVKTTQEAYSRYAADGYDKDGEGNAIQGENDTDYLGTTPTNATSSDRNGFRSNDGAKTTYKHNGVDEEKSYPHPVIQVFEAPIQLQKIDQTGKPLEGAKFDLFKDAYDASGTEAAATANAKNRIKTGLTSVMKGEAPNQVAEIAIEKLRPGTYYLVETEAPAGYILIEPIKIVVSVSTTVENGTTTDNVNLMAFQGEQGMTNFLTRPNAENTKWVLKIQNNAGIALPNTGGPGTRLFTILGSILILGAGVLLYRRRRIV